MTQRWFAPVLGLALAVSIGMARPAAAFRLRLGIPGAHATHSAAVPVSETVTGIIQGQPSGKVYTVKSSKRTNKVDVSGVKARTKAGQYASLKPGTFIRAEGSRSGDTLKATSVTVLNSGGKKGGSKSVAKSAGSKAKKKM